MARLSLVPKTAVSPSPPLKGSATAVDLKPQGIRARRLHLSQARPQYLPEFSSAFEICRTSGDTDLQMSVPPMTLPAPIPHPPPTAAPSERLKHSRYVIIKKYLYIQIVRFETTHFVVKCLVEFCKSLTSPYCDLNLVSGMWTLKKISIF